MRKLLLILLLASCRGYEDPVIILKGQGYSKIKQLPSRVLDCTADEKTHHSYSFTAYKDGQKVKGVICYDWDGGHIVVIKMPRKIQGE